MADVADAPGVERDDLLPQLVRELRAQQAELNELHRDLASLRDQTESRSSASQERTGNGRVATTATVARAMVLEQLRGEADSLRPFVDERLGALEEQCRATEELTRVLHERMEHIDGLYRVMAADTTARLNQLGVEVARLIEEFSGRLASHRAGDDDQGAQAPTPESRQLVAVGRDQSTLVREFQRRLSKLVHMCNVHSEGTGAPQPQPRAPEVTGAPADARPDQARPDQAELQAHVDAVAASLQQQATELRDELTRRLEGVEAGLHRRHGGWHEQGAPQAQDEVRADDTLPEWEKSRPPAPAGPAQPPTPDAGPSAESQELEVPVSMCSDILESSTIPEESASEHKQDHLENMEPLISEELKNNLERLVEKVHEAAVVGQVHEAAVVGQVSSSASLGLSSTFVPPLASAVATVAPSSATCRTAAVPAAPMPGQAPSPVGAGSPTMLSRVLPRSPQPPEAGGAQCHEMSRLTSASYASPTATPGTTYRTVRVHHGVAVATPLGTSSPPSSVRRQTSDVPVVLRARVQSPAPKPHASFSPMLPSQAGFSPTQPGHPPALVQRSVSQGHWIGVAAPALSRPPAGQRL